MTDLFQVWAAKTGFRLPTDGTWNHGGKDIQTSGKNK